MIILQLSDFKGGKYDLPDAVGMNTKIAYVQPCIDKYERSYIHRLLGATTGNLFITWVQASQNPANADYLKILNSFAEDASTCYYYGSTIIESLGMKEFLKAAIFYEYVKNALITSQPGITIPASETGSIQFPASTLRFAENKFNEVLSTIESIQWYCANNRVAFPDFNGQHFNVKSANFF